MFRRIMTYGIVAGLVVGVPLSLSIVSGIEALCGGIAGMIIGYTMMLVAFSAIFIAIKHQRDIIQGGVISFWKGLGIGLAISAVAGVIYVAVRELCQAVGHFDFARVYGDSMITQAKARGAGPAEIARVSAEAAEFRREYANPLWRLPMSFTEIFPVGVLVSLVSAGLLRNSRFLPARRV